MIHYKVIKTIIDVLKLEKVVIDILVEHHGFWSQ